MSGQTYPKDIESGVQWRIRHPAPGQPDREVVRIMTEAQARVTESRLIDLGPVVEARAIVVGEWGDPAEAEAVITAEEPDEADE